MSKLHRRGHMLRSDAPNESCKRGRRPEYLEMLVNRCLAQDANISPETSAPVETSSAATNTSAHTEEAASHAAKAEKYAQVTADILGKKYRNSNRALNHRLPLPLSLSLLSLFLFSICFRLKFASN